MLKREVPPDILDGMVPRNLLPSGDKLGNVVGIDVVALIVGNSVHIGRSVERWRREDSWVPSKATQKEVLTTQPSSGPSLI